ncbi:hypothetical protein [Paracoccus marcusii]|uniref:hypothetical protein n=1 Tax=Paracoccus marcusii TaxID=59779 RepID=UPI0032636F1A
MLEDAFMLLARDGGGPVEIQHRLQRSVAALSDLGSSSFRAAVRKQATLALNRADALCLKADREMVIALQYNCSGGAI